ncbi:prolipoprotein diacylglyceryl transferase [Oscillospiraceae bacterium PP1C4]
MNQSVSFPGIGIGEFTINRIAFSIGNVHVYWYGIIIAAAFLAGVSYLLRRSRTFGLDSDRVIDVILGASVGGIIGARTYYVLFSWSQYKDNLMDVFKIWEGGIAIYGGVIGGFLAGYLMCRLRRVKFVPMADLAVGGLILGQAIGRWGNFVNVEAFGSNTTAPWGMVSPSITEYLTIHQPALAAQGVMVDPGMAVHPTFFYESVWCLLGFLVIALFTKHRRFDGELTLIYAAWYGLGRSVIEGLRTDSLMWGNIRVSQALAIVLVVVSVVAFIIIHTKIKKSGNPDFKKLYVNTEEGQAVLSGKFYSGDHPAAPKEDTKPESEALEDASEPETTEQAPDLLSDEINEPDTTKGEDKN